MGASERVLEAQKEARRHIPNVLRALLRVTDTTQQELGDALGLTQTAVSRRLRGVGQIPQDELAAIAAFFNVPVASLYKPLSEAIADVLVDRSDWTALLAATG